MLFVFVYEYKDISFILILQTFFKEFFKITATSA